MSSPYTGLARPAVAQDAPSPAPSPAGSPIANVPADIDPNNSATMFAQQYPTAMDWIAWLSKTARHCPPVAYGSATGFSAVAHVGPGTGTVVPSGSSNGGYYIVVKIIGSGGLGVGTFQLSRDGGSTYAVGTTTIPGGGAHTDATSGITITFAGTFTAADTYAFHSAFTPMLQFADQAATPKKRFLVDHNGYPLGRISAHREDWLDGPAGMSETTDSLAAIATPLDLGSKWRFSGTTGVNNVSIAVFSASPGAPAGRVVGIATQAAAPIGDKVYLRTRARVWGYSAAQTSDRVTVLEGTLYPTNFASSTLLAGFFDNFTTMTSSTNRIWFEKTTASANWFARVNGTTVDTTVAPTANGNRYRIEIHGSATALGASKSNQTVVLFFLNEALVATIQNVLADGDYGIGFGIEQTGAGTVGSMSIGPCAWAYNHVGDVPAL